MDDHQNAFASKLNDLTYSLNRTTDVLSTADHMIDHYKDQNREQENEIARVSLIWETVGYQNFNA